MVSGGAHARKATTIDDAAGTLCRRPDGRVDGGILAHFFTDQLVFHVCSEKNRVRRASRMHTFLHDLCLNPTAHIGQQLQLFLDTFGSEPFIERRYSAGFLAKGVCGILCLRDPDHQDRTVLRRTARMARA